MKGPIFGLMSTSINNNISFAKRWVWISTFTKVSTYRHQDTSEDTWCQLPGSIVHHGIFQQCTKDKEDTNSWPDINSLGVSDRRQRTLNTGLRGWHGKQGCHSQSNTCGYCFMIQPEWHPWNRNSHGARYIHGHNEEWELSSKQEFDSQTRICS